MWKDFFYFSKADKRAILLLVGLIGLMGIGNWIYTALEEDEAAPQENQQEIEAFLASVREKEELIVSAYPKKKRREPVVLSSFDPNEADSAEFVRLGLPPFMARNIMRYREKGGVFRTVESFAKVYGLTTEQYETLKPYIRIGEAYQPVQRDTTLHQLWVARMDSLKALKYPEGTVIDLNAADTSELKKIPGIGSAYARQIVAYRNRLGGFYSVEQLQELPFSSKEFNAWFKVEQKEHPFILVNKWSVEHLRSHPYLNFYQSKVIVEHRKKYGKLKSLSQLSLYEEFTEKDFERLSPYISFD